jgi:Carboxypeptidase regulatory-like domain
MNIFTDRNKLVRQDASAVASEETPSQKRKGYAALGILQCTSLAILMAALALVALNVVTSSAFGQANSDIAGKLTDSTGAIPRATVTLINNGTGAARATSSNDQDDWLIPNIPPVNYKLRIEKSGFKVAEIPSMPFTPVKNR